MQYTIDEETMKYCKALEFYDDHGYFPWDKKNISITLSMETIEKLNKVKNKSVFIENLIN